MALMFVFTTRVPTDVQMSEGSHSYFNEITMSYSAMGMQFERQVPVGYWIGIDRPNPGKQPCQASTI
jgi:hypothetical protein